METEKIGLPGLSEWKTRKREALARWEKHQQAMLCGREKFKGPGSV